MKIPFVDLKIQYQSIKDEIICEINKILNNNEYILGKEVANFEQKFAGIHKANFCVGTNNGTSALQVALNALLQPNGINNEEIFKTECIIPVNTYIATAEAVAGIGAKVVLVDCNQFYNIDVNKIEEKITSKTKVLIPVHLYGQPADMDPILKLAEKYKLFVLEDCAQAHLATYKGKSVGTFGDIGAFSFYPGKNLGAYGEAGACITNSEKLYDYMYSYRNHGQSSKYYHDIIGHNFRMEGIQGAVLNVKLRYLEKWTELRRKNAYLYNKYLKNTEHVETPNEIEDSYSVYHLYVIKVKDRNKLCKHLEQNGIATGIHYPIPINEQKAFFHLNDDAINFPTIDKDKNNILSLPMYPELTSDKIEYISKVINEFYQKL